jgi:hypothetical protein
MADPEWARGDMLGLSIPAHSEALRIAGKSFLTDAFRASGSLAADNRVVDVARFEDWPGGSTGRQLLLSVAYEKPAPGLHTELFVKFWLMDAPALIQAQIRDLTGVTDRFDPRFEANETARVQLHMMTTFLHLWNTQDFGNLLSRMHRG